MTNEESKKALQEIDKQIPNPYYKNVWYDVIMPNGKPAGVRCIHLTVENYCKIHDQPDYPAVCRNLKPSTEMCGESFDEAMKYLIKLEKLTSS